LRLPDTIWVQYGDVEVSRDGDEIVVLGKNDDAYLKVLNHFGRVLKLYTHESGKWEDADTGGPPTGFDMALAGRLPAPPHIQPSSPIKATGKAGGRKPTSKKTATGGTTTGGTAKKTKVGKSGTRKSTSSGKGKSTSKAGNIE